MAPDVVEGLVPVVSPQYVNSLLQELKGEMRGLHEK
ncbi:hypothetical protein LCGC14_3092830, partial [marine sediment metagenome]